VSKFLNEDLSGMTKITKRDPNMNMKRGVLITDGSMHILTPTPHTPHYNDFHTCSRGEV